MKRNAQQRLCPWSSRALTLLSLRHFSRRFRTVLRCAESQDNHAFGGRTLSLGALLEEFRPLRGPW